MTIEEQIFHNSIQQPDQIALITPVEQVTYAQLWERCLLAATNVKRKYGLKQGDRIILSASAHACALVLTTIFFLLSRLLTAFKFCTLCKFVNIIYPLNAKCNTFFAKN